MFWRLLSAALLCLPLYACNSDSDGASHGPADSLPEEPLPEEPEPEPDPAPLTLEQRLRQLVDAAAVTPLEDAPAVSDALFNAGTALFGGTSGAQLSGPHTVSCASCHPTNNAGIETAVALHASLGSAATIHRNSIDLVNKVLGGRRAMFWDGRLSIDDIGEYHTPAGDALPDGLNSLLAAQALFPLLSRDEMLGYADDGSDDNELADLNTSESPEQNPWPVWNAIAARVKAHATLGPLLQAAYPDVAFEELGIAHIANAIAAFEIRRWKPPLTPANFHAWLRGTGDLTDKVKRGAILFFDKAGCAGCHKGPLLSDGEYHNLAVPQIGPGFGSGALEAPPRDKGRYEVSGDEADLYAFLTPSLWEVKVTPPYMHNGVYSSLEQAVRHHLDAVGAANGFRCTDPGVPEAVLCNDSASAPDLYADLLDGLAPDLRSPIELSEEEISDLMAFLNTLTNGAN